MLKDNLYAELMEDLQPKPPACGNPRRQPGDRGEPLPVYREYDDSILRVKCRGCEVRILGADLELTALSMDELAVMGVISSVEYITTE